MFPLLWFGILAGLCLESPLGLATDRGHLLHKTIGILKAS
jgi:hypothetical protein